MIDAPFTGSAAASALAPLAAIFIALGGVFLIAGAARRHTGRALALGATVALLAGVVGHVFR